MPTRIPVKEFINLTGDMPVIDVRSPGEYAQAHIPGAISLPLFNNEERAKIGTLYKQQGKIISVQKGLEIVGPKMKDFTKVALKLNSPKLLMYCWRGGMRSASMAWLLETVGLSVYLLEDGYKAYRHEVLNKFEEPVKILLIGGYTGAGKTELLYHLRDMGEQIIDLEGLANHKGSAFGSLGQSEQPTTEYFENLLFNELQKTNPQKRVWIEDESHNIGRVYIPQKFWEQMRKSQLIKISTSYEVRIERLMRDYAHFSTEELVTSIKKIEKRLGYDKCKRAIDACLNGNKEIVTKLCLDYYDKAYGEQLDIRFGNRDAIPSIHINSLNIEDEAKKLIKFANKNR